MQLATEQPSTTLSVQRIYRAWLPDGMPVYIRTRNKRPFTALVLGIDDDGEMHIWKWTSTEQGRNRAMGAVLKRYKYAVSVVDIEQAKRWPKKVERNAYGHALTYWEL